MTRLALIAFGLAFILAMGALAQERPDGSGALLAAAAMERTTHGVIYDGAYRRLDYPGGDVAADRGVCTDVVIRSYRAVGVDLQPLIHEDMLSDFAAYPANWGLTGPDANIDHRRVPILRRYFERKGISLAISDDVGDFLPGDLVSWNLVSKGSLPHIGVVSSQKLADGTPLVVHNIGAGPKLEDVLFAYEITGHYRFHPKASS